MKTWGQANRALGLIAGIERRLARLGGEADRLRKRRTKWGDRLEAFTRAHEGEMEGRSRKMPHGRVWLHQATTLTARSWAKVLEWLKREEMHSYIRTKEELDKDALRQAEPDLIESCGAKLKTEDVFGYEAR
jgi:phage host-nuclease inhibitor protein Gam